MNEGRKHAGAPLVSVVVNNHNYGRFLGDAIDSALAQLYPHVEVIVVDDGSTDDSRRIIATYAGRITPVLKPRGGQASALNAGFAASRGSGVCFLDADDTLDPRTLMDGMCLLGPGVANVRWSLREMDESGRPTGGRRPGGEMHDGDLSEVVLSGGPDTYMVSPTSGNLWSRGFLEQVMPMPEDAFELCADAYLFGLSPLYGELRSINQPLGGYRLHGANFYAALDFEDKLDRDIANWESRCQLLAARCRELGRDANVVQWRAGSWFHRLRDAVDTVCGLVPPGANLILIDEDQWGVTTTLRGRHVRPFPEQEGKSWGRPAGDEDAVRELERQRSDGAQYAVVAWPAFWWLEHYRELALRLRAHRTVFEDDRVVVFELAA